MTVYALDTETNGYDIRYHPDAKVMGVSIAHKHPSTHRSTPDKIESYYWPLNHIEGNYNTYEDAVQHIDDLLRNPHNTWIFHNAKFDLRALELLGVSRPLHWYDTMLMQYMLDSNLLSYSLDHLANKYFKENKIKDPLMDAFIAGPGWSHIPVWLIKPYAEKDAELTLKLFHKLFPLFQKAGFDG